jgi:hypothetical protein
VTDLTVDSAAELTQAQYDAMSEDDYAALPEDVRKVLEDRVEKGELHDELTDDAKALQAVLDKIDTMGTEGDGLTEEEEGILAKAVADGILEVEGDL